MLCFSDNRSATNAAAYVTTAVLLLEKKVRLLLWIRSSVAPVAVVLLVLVPGCSYSAIANQLQVLLHVKTAVPLLAVSVDYYSGSAAVATEVILLLAAAVRMLSLIDHKSATGPAAYMTTAAPLLAT